MTFAANNFRISFFRLIGFAVTVATFSGCAGSGGTAQEHVYQTPHGVAIVDTFTTVATVAAIDTGKRKVTMMSADGKSSTYKAASGIDLSQFQVGEKIGLQVTDETALAIKSGGKPAADVVATSLATAAGGGAGAVFEGEAVEVSAKIVALDAKAHRVTLQYADGTVKTMKVHGSVDLTGLAVGNTVTVKYAVSVVVAVADA